MAMMINQRLKEASSDQEDEDGLERIDLEALRRMDQKQGNPLKPYREEEASKPSDKYENDKYDKDNPADNPADEMAHKINELDK